VTPPTPNDVRTRQPTQDPAQENPIQTLTTISTCPVAFLC
jgi:hypothetical protein